MAFPSRSRPPARGAFGVVFLVVGVGFGLVCVLLLTQLGSAQSVAAERRLSVTGTVAEVACLNALTEANWSLLSRANSPRLSEREAERGRGPDLFRLLRGPAMTEPVEFDFTPAISRRLMASRRAALGKVAVRLQLLRVNPAPATTITTGALPWPPPANTAGLPLPIPPGWIAGPGQAQPSRSCNLRLVQFNPQLVAEGVLELTVEGRAGLGVSAARRRQIIRKTFAVWQMDLAGTLKLVRIAPGCLAQEIERAGSGRPTTRVLGGGS